MAEKRKIPKKVISKTSSETPSTEEEVSSVEAPVIKTETLPKRGCYFCKNGLNPVFTDTQLLRKFLSDRGKILPRARTDLCSKHQRFTTREIKYARHLALLPFTPKV